eukprot:TRINITY_DN48782_c0_g1_i1.p1 TRINITY_DN48782_c0_g1~~TRINITY_DN48782_c0_g1_i1.p1  ORF type:complete len:490 (+),score=112.62 TRINITY_DN48782_c0_g1_i1:43-1470(+)
MMLLRPFARSKTLVQRVGRRACAASSGDRSSSEKKVELARLKECSVTLRNELRKVRAELRELEASMAQEKQKEAQPTPEKQKEAQPMPWHVFSPLQLAGVSTVANLCNLTAGFAHDHMFVRLFAGSAASLTAAFNFLMPKPLKQHQWTAGLWATAFATLHFANVAWLLHEHQHSVHLTQEESDIYDAGFQTHGVTPRQFGEIVHMKGKVFRNCEPGELIVKEGDAVDQIVYIVQAGDKLPVSRLDRNPDTAADEVVLGELPQHCFVGILMPEHWRATEMSTEPPKQDLGAYMDDSLKQKAAANASKADAMGSMRMFKKQADLHGKSLKDVLLEGVEEAGLVTTELLEGNRWNYSVHAGESGCRIMQWPLKEFAAVVGKDEKLVDAMNDFALTSLAHKLSSGSDRAGEEAYQDLLKIAVLDGRIQPEEKVALRRHRIRHKISDVEHEQILRKIGWTVQEYNDGAKVEVLQRKRAAL